MLIKEGNLLNDAFQGKYSNWKFEICPIYGLIHFVFLKIVLKWIISIINIKENMNFINHFLLKFKRYIGRR